MLMYSDTDGYYIIYDRGDVMLDLCGIIDAIETINGDISCGSLKFGQSIITRIEVIETALKDLKTQIKGSIREGVL